MSGRWSSACLSDLQRQVFICKTRLCTTDGGVNDIQEAIFLFEKSTADLLQQLDEKGNFYKKLPHFLSAGTSGGSIRSGFGLAERLDGQITSDASNLSIGICHS
ncbi:hypothetical protein FRC16_001553 [Serendipita sp. 398]|nr:hypothetical protein FRC16_001553 [Serendipita sp. 398]